MTLHQLTILRAVFAAAMLLLVFGAARPGAALEIQFDYRFDTNNFFDAQPKKDALEAAAAQYELLIVDRLDAIVPRNPSFNQWDPTFRHPGTNEPCCPGEGPLPSALANLAVVSVDFPTTCGGEFDWPS